MKQISLLILIGVAMLAGCARNYTVTLTNGTRVTGIGKPRLEGATYVFKDAKGKPIYVPAGRVREIAPTSMSAPRQSSGFKAESTQ